MSDFAPARIPLASTGLEFRVHVTEHALDRFIERLGQSGRSRSDVRSSIHKMLSSARLSTVAPDWAFAHGNSIWLYLSDSVVLACVFEIKGGEFCAVARTCLTSDGSDAQRARTRLHRSRQIRRRTDRTQVRPIRAARGSKLKLH